MHYVLKSYYAVYLHYFGNFGRGVGGEGGSSDSFGIRGLVSGFFRNKDSMMEFMWTKEICADSV